MAANANTSRRRPILSMIVMAIIADVAWVILSGTLSIQNIILGFIFGLAINIAIRENTNIPTVGEELSLRNIPGQLIAFMYYLITLAYDIFRSGLDVAQRILRPTIDIDPGIYVIRVHDPDERGLVEAITAHGISITPGSLVIDFDEAHDIVIVHVLDRKKWTVESLDAEQVVRVRRIHRLLGDNNPDRIAYDPAEYMKQ